MIGSRMNKAPTVTPVLFPSDRTVGERRQASNSRFGIARRIKSTRARHMLHALVVCRRHRAFANDHRGAKKKPRAKRGSVQTGRVKLVHAFWIATPEPLMMSTPLVSRRKRAPITSVITDTPIGYHRPA